MRDKRAKGDLVIARIAARQHGVVSSSQLTSAGLSREAVRRRTIAGRLHRVHRGVYAVGHANLRFEGRCMAAALAIGGGAVLSHHSAAAVWAMLRPHGGRIHVTVPGNGGRRKRQGITIHRSHSLISAVTTRRDGIAVTKPARTLRDLHSSVPKPVFRAAVRRALDLRLISEADLRPDADLTRSELERAFLSLCRRHRLPQPEVNARLGAYEVDFLWREASLVAETDGFRHHGHRVAFEADRVRDVHLQSQGVRVLRFTYRQIHEEARQVAAVLQKLLA